jgi:hypothetical protein
VSLLFLVHVSPWCSKDTQPAALHDNPILRAIQNLTEGPLQQEKPLQNPSLRFTKCRHTYEGIYFRLPAHQPSNSVIDKALPHASSESLAK